MKFLVGLLCATLFSVVLGYSTEADAGELVLCYVGDDGTNCEQTGIFIEPSLPDITIELDTACGLRPGDMAWGIPVPREALGAVRKAFTTENQCKALCTIRYESEFNPYAINTEGSSASGPAQFLIGSWLWYQDYFNRTTGTSFEYTLDERFGWWPSVQMMALVVERFGWSPWLAARKC